MAAAGVVAAAAVADGGARRPPAGQTRWHCRRGLGGAPRRGWRGRLGMCTWGRLRVAGPPGGRPDRL